MALAGYAAGIAVFLVAHPESLAVTGGVPAGALAAASDVAVLAAANMAQLATAVGAAAVMP